MPVEFPVIVSGILSGLLMHLLRDKRNHKGKRKSHSFFLSNITSTKARSDFSPCQAQLEHSQQSYLQCIVKLHYKVWISGPAIFIVLSRDNLVRCFSCACWIPAIFGDQLFSVLLSPINCVYKGGKVKVGIRQERDNETFLRVLLEKAENHTESNKQYLSHEGSVTIDMKGKED